jgi:hypothetical protein
MTKTTSPPDGNHLIVPSLLATAVHLPDVKQELAQPIGPLSKARIRGALEAAVDVVGKPCSVEIDLRLGKLRVVPADPSKPRIGTQAPNEWDDLLPSGSKGGH